MPPLADYRRGTAPAWTLAGRGFERLALATWPIPAIGPDQVLVRCEVSTICYSSVKVIETAGGHPRLGAGSGPCELHPDRFVEPIVLGDEAFAILEKVGEHLKDRFAEGQGCAIMPTFASGAAFGYGPAGGLARYCVLEGPQLDGLLPVSEAALRRSGMFAAALSEPLGCVEKSLSLTYRSSPREGGVMLIVGDGDVDATLDLAPCLAAGPPARIVLAKAGARLREAVESISGPLGIPVAATQMNAPDGRTRQFSPQGWDDIVLATGRAGLVREWVEDGATALKRGGVMALVGEIAPGTRARLELGGPHYADTLLVGARGPDLIAAYRATAEFGPRPGRRLLLLGAGGPMGQLALLWLCARGTRAPDCIWAVEPIPERLARLRRLGAQAPPGCAVECIDPAHRQPDGYLEGSRIDDLVTMAPTAQALLPYLPHLASGAIVNLFAGLRGERLEIDLHDVAARGIRFVGHSGDDLPSQRAALDSIVDARIEVAPVVAAVGGVDAAWDALWAARERLQPGKIAIYMGCRHPLTPVETITGGEPWSARHERAFMEACR